MANKIIDKQVSELQEQEFRKCNQGKFERKFLNVFVTLFHIVLRHQTKTELLLGCSSELSRTDPQADAVLPDLGDLQVEVQRCRSYCYYYHRLDKFKQHWEKSLLLKIGSNWLILNFSANITPINVDQITN